MKLITSCLIFLIIYSDVSGQDNKQDSIKIRTINIDSLIKNEINKKKKWNDEQIGKPYYGLTLLSEKSAIPLSILSKKTIFLNFWFATCHPCIMEFKGLNQLYVKVRSDSNIIFLTVTFENEEQIRQTKEKYKLEFPILSIDEKICRELNFDNGYPTTIILENGGIIKKIYSGGYSSEKEATEFVLITIFPELVVDR